jgi:hypothetical protein
MSTVVAKVSKLQGDVVGGLREPLAVKDHIDGLADSLR